MRLRDKSARMRCLQVRYEDVGANAVPADFWAAQHLMT